MSVWGARKFWYVSCAIYSCILCFVCFHFHLCPLGCPAIQSSERGQSRSEQWKQVLFWHATYVMRASQKQQQESLAGTSLRQENHCSSLQSIKIEHSAYLVHHILLCAGFDMQSIEAIPARYPSARTGMRQQWHHRDIFKLQKRSVPDGQMFL